MVKGRGATRITTHSNHQPKIDIVEGKEGSEITKNIENKISVEES